MIVPELPADIAALKRDVGRFIEAEVYPFEQRIAVSNEIDHAQVDLLFEKARGCRVLDAQHARRQRGA